MNMNINMREHILRRQEDEGKKFLSKEMKASRRVNMKKFWFL